MQRINHTAPPPKAKRASRQPTRPRTVRRTGLEYVDRHVIVPPHTPRIPNFPWLKTIGKFFLGIIHILMVMAIYHKLILPQIPPNYEYQVTMILLSVLFFIFIFNPLTKRITEHRANIRRAQSAQSHHAVLVLSNAVRGGRLNISNLEVRRRYRGRRDTPPPPPPPPRPRRPSSVDIINDMRRTRT
jgi:hypothetical protein